MMIIINNSNVDNSGYSQIKRNDIHTNSKIDIENDNDVIMTTTTT